MKIVAVETDVHALALSRPYTIAFRHIASIEVVTVRLVGEGGVVGYGAGSPESHVTGETNAECQAALDPAGLGWLVGRDVRALPALCRRARELLPAVPAARAAIDIAAHDLLAKSLDLPLVELLGRAHQALPTSVTIGILGVDETLAEAREHVAARFRVLKIKLGHSLAEDIERLRAVRSELGDTVAIRVDPNQGYSAQELADFVAATGDLDIEFVEQPMKADAIDALRALPLDVRNRVAADESMLSADDAARLVSEPRACGIFNIKLMKCGGIHEAGRIATIAESTGVELMWGCMDESVISIAGALHAALASPATRYLDLDGSLDLARDVARGGFILEDGTMSTAPGAGLGVEWLG